MIFLTEVFFDPMIRVRYIYFQTITYTGKIWGEIGPTLFTKVSRQMCPKVHFALQKDEQNDTVKCGIEPTTFSILPAWLGQPLWPREIHLLYDSMERVAFRRFVEKSWILHYFSSGDPQTEALLLSDKYKVRRPCHLRPKLVKKY